MKKMPMVLAGMFIAITLVRVAALAAEGFQAGALGWLFSAGLGAGIFISSYYSRVSATGKDGEEDRRSKQTRDMALISMILFVAVDGYFNIMEVQRSLQDETLRIAAVLYGAFPTLAAALLGGLQGRVDRLPHPPQKASVSFALRAWIVSQLRIDAGQPQECAQPAASLRAEPQVAAFPEPRYRCECGYTTDVQQAFAAHARKHRRREMK